MSTATFNEQSDLAGFVSLLRRQVFLIVSVAALTCGFTLLFSVIQTDKYRASAKVLYAEPGVGGGIAGGDVQRAVETFVRVAESETVLLPVARSIDLSTDELRASVSVTGDASANIITTTATAGTAAGAATVANAVASSLISWREQQRDRQARARIEFLRQQLAALEGTASPSARAAAADIRTQLAEATAQVKVPSPELSVVSPAARPSAPFAPQPGRNAIVGLFAGLVLGLILAVLRDRLDRSVRSVDEVESLYPWPLLGVVPHVGKASSRRRVLVDFSEMSVLADAYRSVRTNLVLVSSTTVVNGRRAPLALVISSATPGEGKSSATANLAGAFAGNGMSVLAISADLHSPTLHEFFDPARNGQPGLVEVLAGEARAEEAIRRVRTQPRSRESRGSVDLLGNETTFSDPATLYESPAMMELLASVRRKYDVILIDAPPLLVTAEGSLLARVADGLILVGRINQLTRHQAQRTVRLLETMQLRPSGVVVTGLDALENHYGYRRQTEESRPKPVERLSPTPVDRRA